MNAEESYFADTSFLIDLLRSHEDALEVLNSSYSIITGSICVFELKRKTDADLEWVEDRFIRPLTFKDAEKASEISREMSEKGKKINTSDYLIAAQALNLDRKVVTSDSDFEEVPGLEVLRYK